MRRESAGMGSFAEATAPERMTRAQRIAEVERLVPGECLSFALTAADFLRYRGLAVTRESVLASLERQGRTMRQLKEGDVA